MTASCPPPSTSEPSREEQARALCLRLLTARARTRAELAGQLAKRGYPDDVSTRVFDRFGDDTVVYPGHGDDTTLGAERPNLANWRQRGW